MFTFSEFKEASLFALGTVGWIIRRVLMLFALLFMLCSVSYTMTIHAPKVSDAPYVEDPFDRANWPLSSIDTPPVANCSGFMTPISDCY